MTEVVRQAQRLQQQLVQWRRHVHAHPEVGAETAETAAFIAGELSKLGLEIRTGVGGNGVVGLLRGGRPGKTLAIRADIDALPVTEETGLPFASRTPGRMHACAHDAHAAMALGAAALLATHKDDVAGNVKFLFQPAEERPGGAKPMIDDGAMENPHVDGVIGLHTGNIWLDVPAGDVRVAHGPMMAAMELFELKIAGKAGHAATPHRTVDAIAMAAQVVTALQTIVSREIDPTDTAVVTIGQIAGGTTNNVIAGEVILRGTTRAYRAETQQLLRRRIAEIAGGITAAMRGSCECHFTVSYPPVVNDPAFTDEFAAVARDVLGAGHVAEIAAPTMGGEDMAFFLQKAPGTFFFLAGCNAEKGQVHPHHHPKFDIDEAILWRGPALFAAFALRWLSDA